MLSDLNISYRDYTNIKIPPNYSKRLNVKKLIDDIY